MAYNDFRFNDISISCKESIYLDIYMLISSTCFPHLRLAHDL